MGIAGCERRLGALVERGREVGDQKNECRPIASPRAVCYYPDLLGAAPGPQGSGSSRGAPTWSDHEAAPRGERGGAEPGDGEAAGQDGTLSENTLNSERPLSEGRGRHIKARPDRDVKRKKERTKHLWGPTLLRTDSTP